MKITWLGHASFLLETETLRIITDPYDPEDLKLAPVETAADIVIRSSPDDIAHAYVDSIPPGFELLTATDFAGSSATAKGIEFKAIGALESLYRKGGYRDNALYRFRLDGVEIAHMGDVGNSLDEEQLEFLSGTDLLFALAGGHPTIELDDLERVIEKVHPKMVIPMHFRVPGPEFFMLPVDEFVGRFPAEQVTRVGSESISLDATDVKALSPTPQIRILEAQNIKAPPRTV